MGHPRTLLSFGWIYLFVILAGCSAVPRNISEDVDALVQALSLESTELSDSALQKIGRGMKDDDLLRVLKEAEDLTSNELWIPFFESLYKYYPKPSIAYLLAEAKCRSGNTEVGMSILNEAIQEGFSNESLLYRASLLAYTQKHYTEAQKWLEQLLEVNPKNGEALFLRGTILSREKYFDRARIDLQSALELEPNHRLAEYELGVLEDRAGNHEQAERHLRSVIDKQPFFIEAYKGLLSVLIKQGKREEINRFETIAEYLETWDRDKIQTMWAAFTNPDTLPPQTILELAMEYCQVGRDDLGERVLLKQVEGEQANDGMFLLLAQIQQNHKRYESCLNTLDRIANPQRRQSELFAALKAWSLFQLGRFEECKSYYEEMQPKFPESRHFIALQEAMQKKGI